VSLSDPEIVRREYTTATGLVGVIAAVLVSPIGG
jgi:hypothetical protein